MDNMTNEKKVIKFITGALDKYIELDTKYAEVELKRLTSASVDLVQLTNIQNLRLANLRTIVQISMFGKEEEKYGNDITKTKLK